MDVKADSNRINIKSLVYYTISKWWLYCIILILTAGVIFAWQTIEIKQENMSQQKISLTQEEQEQLDAFYSQQESVDVLNQYNANSIYMKIDPYNETCCIYLFHIRNSEMASQMVFNIEELFQGGTFAQMAAEQLQINSKYLDELICYELMPMDHNEYIAKIMILMPDNDQRDLFEQVYTEILQTNILNRYSDAFYVFEKNMIERVDNDLLSGQQNFLSRKATSDNMLVSLKTALSERQLSVLNNTENPAVKTTCDLGAVIKIAVALTAFAVILVMLYFVQNNFICIKEDVEQAFDIRGFYLKGPNKRQNSEMFHQLFGFIKHIGASSVYFCKPTERGMLEKQFADIAQESSLEIKFINKLYRDYTEADLEKGMKDFVVCLKKGKTRLKELQRLYAYCKEMDYRILAIVLF